ncbi:hypothetical protein [Natronosalvus rutilus]|uniref:Uncharacterized protein n=1 Tax=Natronosalvus rutilus TaxID=2953753 RepID=A0A9E7N8N9_9EURY|nr:hypothetical protein [Natronosalvus rutilus]UTF52383.1 hypothetical protein NGM29_11335 [Natronosalvus rutilus]
MTDSTTDEKSREGDFDIGPSMDELFGEIEDDSADEEPVDPDETAHGDGVEDVTAADLFSQLRDEAAADPGMDEVLEDESPEEIIASADEDDEPDHDVDDELVDEGALDDLLLTGRTRSDEFLWIDSGDDSSSVDDGDSGATETESIQGTDGAEDDSESVSEPESELESGSEPEPETESGFVVEDEGEGEGADMGEADVDVDDNVEHEDDSASGFEAESKPEAERAESVDEPDSVSDVGDADDDDESAPEPDTTPRAGRVDYSLESTASDEESTSGEESALVVSDAESTETDLVPTDDGDEDEDSSGFLGWLRSKLPF